MKNKPQQLFDCIYQDTVIHFLLEKEGDVMVNATEMAKLFNREIKDFNKMKSTNDFIEAALISEENSLINVKTKEDILFSVKKSGTFMHRILALEFAGWLDINFKIWILCRIDEIKFGKIKPLEKAVIKEVSAAQNLDIALHNAMTGDSEEAKELAKAMIDYNEAKKLKNKASRNFNSQLKMSL